MLPAACKKRIHQSFHNKAASIDFQADLITDVEKFAGLKKSWNDLLGRAAYQNIQLTHDWLFSCWQHYQHSHPISRLCLYAVYNAEDDLVALFPMMITKIAYKRLFTAQRLSFLCYEYCDYSDFIIEKGFGEQCLKFFVTHILIDRRLKWDILVLRNIPSEGGHHGLILSGLRKAGFNTHQKEITRFYHIDCSKDSYMSYIGSRSKSHRQNIRTAQNRLCKQEKLGLPTPALVRLRPSLKLLSDLIQLCVRRQKLKKRQSVLQDVNFTKFLSHFVLTHRDFIDLTGLKIGPKLIAFCICLKFMNVHYYWIPGFDQNYERLSPSNILLVQLIREAFDKKNDRFTFMAGASEYKKKWATGHTSGFQIRAANPRSLKSTILEPLFLRGLK